MRVLMIDGHPDRGRLSAHLLDAYAEGLPPDTQVTRMALADLTFDPVLHRGYDGTQPLEPDLERVWAELVACDHLVLAYPMWWGAEPALVSGLFTRLLLPGRAFRDHDKGHGWDRLLAGRSADVIVTMDTPPWLLRWGWGDPLGRRMKIQVLGFVGIAPARVHRLGPVRKGAAERALPRWRRRLKTAAAGIGALRRKPRVMPPGA
ncbi:NAD(P)H-dependent oxidoreductase [Phaeovulum vinaykumarii]|uniref:Putative NADPH-quinone reductase (Modulator of drug activity B) n=1 Tax=Phaeovulum vinaykumarii TaxID=407234 RepID=A0A1N7JXP8_9RHOB|nr:NAD(P)H-dependent oxidoreductase [Phaeovulum vinaykumarii]SIS54119.1 Putative NADPH-quinone reductase (modulator of drug activity B) [Phaeovulum vinaykumarii]SOB91826.1 putative NADPH-quinone reductase [Phaeovulum vinaykumarii]